MPETRAPRPPYVHWPLDRWKIGVAVVLFATLVIWRGLGLEQIENTGLLPPTPTVEPVTGRSLAGPIPSVAAASPLPTPANPTSQALTVNLLGESAVLLPNSLPLLYGTAPVGSTVILTLAGRRYPVEVDADGEWQFVPAQPLPVGMTWIRARLANVSDDAEDGLSKIVHIAPDARPIPPPTLAAFLFEQPLLTATPLITGDGPAGALVQLYYRTPGAGRADLLGIVTIDAGGKWAWRPETPLPPGEHLVWAVIVQNGVPLTRSQPRILTIAPEAASAPAGEPVIRRELASDGITVQRVIITTLVGTSLPRDRLFIYVDGAWQQEIHADDGGRWRYEFPTPLEGTSYDIRIVSVDAEGNPLSSSQPVR